MKDDSCLTVHSGVTHTVSYKRKKKTHSALSVLQKDLYAFRNKCVYLKDVQKGKKGVP